MTYMLLLHCLHPYLLQLSFCHYSYCVIINFLYTSNDTKIQPSCCDYLETRTEAYFPYIAYAFFVFLLLCKKRSVLFKIRAANIEALKFLFCFCRSPWKIIPKDFPNASSMYMLLLQLSYIFSESRVARNTILIQRDVLWTGKI